MRDGTKPPCTDAGARAAPALPSKAPCTMHRPSPQHPTPDIGGGPPPKPGPTRNQTSTRNAVVNSMLNAVVNFVLNLGLNSECEFWVAFFA